MNAEDIRSGLSKELEALDGEISVITELLEELDTALNDAQISPEVIRQYALERLNLHIRHMHIEEKAGQLSNMLDAMIEDVSALQGNKADVIGTIQKTAEDAVGSLGSAQEKISDSFSEVGEAVATAEQKLVALREDFAQLVSGTLDEFVMNPVAACVEQIQARVAQLVEELTESLESIILSGAANADQELRRQLEEVAAPIVRALEEAVDEIFESAFSAILAEEGESSAKREVMEAMLEQAESAFKAVQAALESVRSIASGVGISV